MKEIIFATTNLAKVKQIQSVLAPIGLSVVGAVEKYKLPHIKEDGKTPQENARKKALVYAKALNQTVFSIDNGLYFDDLSLEEQPATHVRRINRRRKDASDEEMLNYYVELVQRFGDTIKGHWEFAICVASSQGNIEETTITSPRIFTKKVSPKMVPGYPLESIQIDPDTGKYISEMNQEEQKKFWLKVIGKEIQQFFKTVAF
jgi:XTP/dITP diphosphohydrolase